MPDALTDAAAEHTRLGRFELIARLASGGMGTVLLARLPGVAGFQRLFALKVLHPQFAASAEFVEMLLDEARIAARIHHPNVVAIHEVCEHDEHGYYLVMDYVEGFAFSDVADHLAPGRARLRLVNRVMLDTLAGLRAAHALTDDAGRGLAVVHRDVSPHNILVGVDGVGRVTDFGLATAAARVSVTRAGKVKGKLAYLAPEQARGERVDARTDLFAAGIVLWEMLTQRRLYKRDTDGETYRAALAVEVPDVRSLAPDVPRALAAVCTRALEARPERRFQTAREMAQALEQAARAHELLADADEVGEWVQATFAPALRARRDAIRAAATAPAPEHSMTTLRSELWVAPLPEAAPAPEQPATEQPAPAQWALEGAPPRDSYPAHAHAHATVDAGADAPWTDAPPDAPPPADEGAAEAPMPLVTMARSSRVSHPPRVSQPAPRPARGGGMPYWLVWTLGILLAMVTAVLVTGAVVLSTR